MKNCYVDANLLVYFKDLESPSHAGTRLILKKLIDQNYQIVISSLVLDEFLYATLHLTYPIGSDKLTNLKLGLQTILKLSDIKLANPPMEPKKHLKVINLMDEFNLLPRDAYHLFIMLENKIKYFATFDKDFDKVFQKGLIKKFE